MNKENEAGHNLVFASSECKEWPCVNDEVESISTGNIYKVLAVGVNQVCVEYHNKNLRVLSLGAIQKPKTAEEALRDDIAQTINDDVYHGVYDKKSLEVFANALLTKYNITPKD